MIGWWCSCKTTIFLTVTLPVCTLNVYILEDSMTQAIHLIRNNTQGEEIDYTFVMDCLKNYKSPRVKVTKLLKKGDLIRVKKGLYIFGQQYRKNSYSPEILANKIYGPSYISREYALSYYGLIPEYVSEITSVSTKKRRNFDTPVGRFSYTRIPLKLYRIGFTLITIRNNETALIATPEKALSDLFYFRGFNPENIHDLSSLLFDDLRLDENLVKKMHIEIFLEILQAGGPKSIQQIIDWIKK